MTPELELVTSSSLGSLLGLRHALEPDHLAAVSTLISGERGACKAAWIGACWGLGHTFTLIAVGVVLVGLGTEMPASASNVFEFGVVMLLIAFGVRAVRQAADIGLAHVHLCRARPQVYTGGWILARRPLLVGAVHGLAGSGALTAMVVATLPTTAARLAYLALFGLGSIVGMAALSGVLGWPVARFGSRRAVGRGVSLLLGCISIGLGLVWGYPLMARLF